MSRQGLETGVLPFMRHRPLLAASVFIAPGAWVIGQVEIGEQSSIWYNCVVRGDEEPIRIGARSNVQDGSVIHTSREVSGTWIGDDVLIGHMCLIHACRLEDRSFIGMGATVLDNAVVESDAMLAAGALLTPGKRVPSGQLWAGRPARFMRDLTAQDLANNRGSIEEYVRLSREHMGALNNLPRHEPHP